MGADAGTADKPEVTPQVSRSWAVEPVPLCLEAQSKGGKETAWRVFLGTLRKSDKQEQVCHPGLPARAWQPCARRPMECQQIVLDRLG